HPSPPLPPPPSSLHLPPHAPTSLPLPSSPLPPLPALLYEVWESSTAAPRPTGGHGIDYGFIGTLDAETKRQRAEEVGYGIRYVWVDLTEAVEVVAPTTLEGVNARVTELSRIDSFTMRLHDYWIRRPWFPERLGHILLGLVWQFTMNCKDIYQQHWDKFRHFRLEIRLMQMIARALVASMAIGLNNMPPRRSSATARAAATATTARAAATAAAAAPLIAATVEQLIKARVFATLANHE
ncbi:hypothetical protein Tco_1580439, partial [Tanacetum coccineum]